MNAASAKAMTLNQLPLPAVGGKWVGIGPFMNSAWLQGKATGARIDGRHGAAQGTLNVLEG
jgi:hypothetical protein